MKDPGACASPFVDAKADKQCDTDDQGSKNSGVGPWPRVAAKGQSGEEQGESS